MKVLIIGLGSIAKKHIDALEEINPELMIYAYRSMPNSSVYKDVVNLNSFQEVKSYKFDFCIISSPTFKHEHDLKLLVDLKIPLFIEKPLSHNLDIKYLVKALKDSGIKTYVACNLRFLESLQFLKKYLADIDKLKINEVNVYCGSYLPDWRADTDFKSTYSANAEMGGGAHLDLIHELDYIYWFFGKPYNVHRVLRSTSSLNISAVDYANYTLEYDNFVTKVSLNYFRRDSKRSFEILLADKTIELNLLRNEVHIDGDLVFSCNQVALDTYKAQMEYFIENISSETFNDISEAFDVLSICLEK
ncbi:MAG: oxidoreductase [Flavobacteriales bacterium]|nr:oxidoreductase [Flavobacteriales bacterium]|tara:strand:+ start:8464 stop:9375 length:912 start_codon:yes stop_codon:yes gene_type:complete